MSPAVTAIIVVRCGKKFVGDTARTLDKRMQVQQTSSSLKLIGLISLPGAAGADRQKGGAIRNRRTLQPAGPLQGGPEGPDTGGRHLQAQLGQRVRQAEVDEEAQCRGYWQ